MNINKNNMYFLYFIKSQKDGSVYVGITENIEHRLKEHNSGKTRSTKSKTPYMLIYKEEYNSKTDARKREIYIKKSWSEKEKILKSINNGGPIV